MHWCIKHRIWMLENSTNSNAIQNLALLLNSQSVEGTLIKVIPLHLHLHQTNQCQHQQQPFWIQRKTAPMANENLSNGKLLKIEKRKMRKNDVKSKTKEKTLLSFGLSFFVFFFKSCGRVLYTTEEMPTHSLKGWPAFF